MQQRWFAGPQRAIDAKPGAVQRKVEHETVDGFRSDDEAAGQQALGPRKSPVFRIAGLAFLIQRQLVR